MFFGEKFSMRAKISVSLILALSPWFIFRAWFVCCGERGPEMQYRDPAEFYIYNRDAHP